MRGSENGDQSAERKAQEGIGTDTTVGFTIEKRGGDNHSHIMWGVDCEYGEQLSVGAHR
jgi:hypothetical protein